MEWIHCLPGGQIESVKPPDGLPEQGFLWLDLSRDEEGEWYRVIEQLTGIALHEEHVRDARNPRHPSFFEATDSYEMVIFQGLAPTTTARYDALKTRPTAFILLPRLLVTVRPEDSVSIELVKSQLRSGRKSRVQTRPIDLMILILSAMVDRFLALRDGLADELTDWQDRLLDEEDPFDDWMELMRARNRLRRLVVIGEGQEDTMLSWREETEHPIEGSLEVRVNDLIEHIRRVKQEVKNLQTDIEALVQIHFAAVAHRTNLIVRALTVITAVFLPLTLIAGIFGMNFDHMPELHSRYGYYVVLGAMTTLGFGLLVWFRRKRWL